MCARERGWNEAGGLCWLYSNGYKQEGFTMYFRLHHDGGPCNLKHTPFEPELEKWYHFAGTYDGSNVNFYVNGENVATLPCPGGST